MKTPHLILVMGPTAAGKTAYAIALAQRLGTEIVSFDSRQFYKELNIGVARPTEAELNQVQHYFVANRRVTEPYNIYTYSEEAMAVIEKLFETHEVVVAVGGSGLYADALTNGVALLPDPSPELRNQLQSLPLEELQKQLQQLDPETYSRIDVQNHVRIQRALEVCITTGQPYSEVMRQSIKPRPFTFSREVVTHEAEVLRERINSRVDLMMKAGLLEEVESLLPYRNINTLNTVGYKELFPIVAGEKPMSDLEQAIEQIKINTWHYAKKQLTWLRRYEKRG